MKSAMMVGVVLIVLGVLGFAIGGVSFAREKKDVDIGPLQFSSKQTNTVPVSPILSTLALVGGLAVLVRRSAGQITK
jgi:hypothetical protein